jgi:hypothetical protein
MRWIRKGRWEVESDIFDARVVRNRGKGVLGFGFVSSVL